MSELQPASPPAESSVYIYGAGGHAMVVATVLEDLGVDIVGMLDDAPGQGHPLSFRVQRGLADREGPPVFDHPVVLAIGDNRARADLAGIITSPFFTAVHPSALIARRVTIGEGTIVLQGSVIQHNARIGRHVLINTAASIDHDNVIGDFVHVSPHATLCGHVEVGEGTHIGAGATVIPSVKIGRWVTIGAGSVVTADVPDGATAVGVPARVIKSAAADSQPTDSC